MGRLAGLFEFLQLSCLFGHHGRVGEARAAIQDSDALMRRIAVFRIVDSFGVEMRSPIPVFVISFAGGAVSFKTAMEERRQPVRLRPG